MRKRGGMSRPIALCVLHLSVSRFAESGYLVKTCSQVMVCLVL